MRNKKFDYHNMKPKPKKEEQAMRRKIEYPDNNTMILEGNNGGDALEILDEGDGKYTFQTGQNCVWNIRKSGTIEEICDFLMKMAMLSQEAGLRTVEVWGEANHD